MLCVVRWLVAGVRCVLLVVSCCRPLVLLVALSLVGICCLRFVFVLSCRCWLFVCCCVLVVACCFSCASVLHVLVCRLTLLRAPCGVSAFVVAVEYCVVVGVGVCRLRSWCGGVRVCVVL